MNIINILRSSWKKATPERIELFTYMNKKHIFTANDIAENFSTIGRASIFRSIKLFAELGIIRKIQVWRSAESYEVEHSHSHHEHMTCNSCGDIISFLSEGICKKIFSEAEKLGFEISQHSIGVFGKCKNCIS